MISACGRKKWLFWGLVFVAIILAAGAFTSQKVRAVSSTYENLRIFNDALYLIQANYVEELKPQQILYGAIQGMLKTLDPHSAFMEPAMYKEMQVETEGSFGGLGIEITVKDDQLTIVAPIEGTPASRVGLKAGDKIIRIDGESTKDMNLQEAVKRMRGPKGSTVTLTIVREGLPAPKDFTMTRDVIRIQSVRSRVIDGNIGYIRLRTFNRNSGEEMEKILTEIKKVKPKGIILDLRNNPGGLLDQAIKVSGLFLPKGELVVYTEGRASGTSKRYRANSSNVSITEPLVVLVNAGSASASEIVAGALQDQGRAVILGVRTFGKASVQSILPLSDGSALRLTTAKYFTPKGREIQAKGITPDIVVAEIVPTQAAKQEERVVREKDLKGHLEGSPPAKEEGKDDSNNGKPDDPVQDPQLNRAIDLLKSWSIFKNMVQPAKAG
ncbi:MAG: S41 family peptidase [Candidatus Tectomicrobia bacterium]|uniref:S41 family peptidase n=1 Tax=Tectimicrobiota bacterium TaxID=2528274 RepID=A0A932GQ00_UNCTE|nr:S41 family peptidase [Candidatus Tectomicrobia bacterium]